MLDSVAAKALLAGLTTYVVARFLVRADDAQARPSPTSLRQREGGGGRGSGGNRGLDRASRGEWMR